MTLRGMACVIGAAMQIALAGPAFAQGPAAPPAQPGPGAQAESEQEELGALAAPELSPAADRPVLYVTGVEVLRTSSQPRLDIVRVTGLASSEGWNSPQLVPSYAGKPADGILDLQLIATPPRLSQSAEGFVPIDAVFPFQEGQPFNGIRVRGSENAIVVRQIPGNGTANVNVDDCHDCVGKKLAPTGAAPSGGNSVRQEDLPKLLRVIRPADGVRGTRINPNRLNLVLGDDDTIVAAFWE